MGKCSRVVALQNLHWEVDVFRVGLSEYTMQHAYMQPRAPNANPPLRWISRSNYNSGIPTSYHPYVMSAIRL